MPDYVFAYHGGGMPETPEEGAKVMAAWQAWYGGMGDALVNPGAPVGMSKTVSSGGVADDGGANPLSGFTVVRAHWALHGETSLLAWLQRFPALTRQEP